MNFTIGKTVILFALNFILFCSQLSICFGPYDYTAVAGSRKVGPVMSHVSSFFSNILFVFTLQNGLTSLQFAAKYGRLNTVRRLLDDDEEDINAANEVSGAR